MQDARAAFFGEVDDKGGEPKYRLDSAFQGQEALEMVLKANAEGDPYSMAFVDVRMPPGWDGVQTITEMWKVAPDLECVICTAFSDYTWSEMARTLGQSDKLLILKKPFDPVEARQFASTLTTKWQSRRDQARMTEALVAAEGQAKAYAASLETVNSALRTGKAAADKAAQTRGEFLRRLSEQVTEDLGTMLEAAEQAPQLDPRLEASLELGHTLLNTARGVVDFQNLESGTYPTQQQQVTLSNVLQAVIDGFQPRAKASQVELNLELGAGLDHEYMADATSIEKLVQLLVDNALRHAGPGQVQAKVWVERSGNWAKPCLYVEVSDSGPGLPSHYEGQMYEPLTQSHEGSRFGIGLALAKQLVQALGGDLVHQRRAPHGSTFTFHVKLSEASANRAA